MLPSRHPPGMEGLTLNTEPLAKPAQAWNLGKRLLTGIPAFLLLLAALLYSPWYVPAAMVAAISFVGLWEYRLLLAALPEKKLPLLPLASGALLMEGGALLVGAPALHGAFAVAVVLLIGWALMEAPANPLKAMKQVGLGLFGLIWIPWFVGHLLLVLGLPGGTSWAIFLMLVVVGNDTFAYLVGTLVGRRPLLPAVSPNKTVEGALGGVVGCMLAAVISHAWVFPAGSAPPPLPHLLILAVVLGLVGQLGDLLESLVKRACGAKDSGCFLPGHGGVLDRLDAFLPSSPFLYYYLVFMQPQF